MGQSVVAPRSLGSMKTELIRGAIGGLGLLAAGNGENWRQSATIGKEEKGKRRPQLSLLWMRSALNQTIQDKRSLPSASPFLLCAPSGVIPTRTSLNPNHRPRQNGGQKSGGRLPFRFFLSFSQPKACWGELVVLGALAKGQAAGWVVAWVSPFGEKEKKGSRPFCAGRQADDGGSSGRRPKESETRNQRRQGADVFLRRLLWRSYCIPRKHQQNNPNLHRISGQRLKESEV